jgi:hypothetical protein
MSRLRSEKSVLKRICELRTVGVKERWRDYVRKSYYTFSSSSKMTRMIKLRMKWVSQHA